MYHITLTDEQRRELNQRAHQKGIHPRTRDRLEMLRLCDAGWHVPRIAQHLGQHEQTVRHWIGAFLDGGFDALLDKPHPGKTSAVTPAIMEALKQEIAKADRTWTAAQIVEWVEAKYGIRISHYRMRIHLRRGGLSYHRTSYTVRHKQHKEQFEEKKASLEMLEKGGTAD